MLSVLPMLAHGYCKCDEEQARVDYLQEQVRRKLRNLGIVIGGVVAVATYEATKAYKAAKAAGTAGGALVGGAVGGPPGAAAGAGIGGTSAGLSAAITTAVKNALKLSPAIIVASAMLRDAQVDRDEAAEDLANCVKFDKRDCNCYASHADRARAQAVAANKTWGCWCNTPPNSFTRVPCDCIPYIPPSSSSGSTSSVR